MDRFGGFRMAAHLMVLEPIRGPSMLADTGSLTCERCDTGTALAWGVQVLTAMRAHADGSYFTPVALSAGSAEVFNNLTKRVKGGECDGHVSDAFERDRVQRRS